MIFSIESSFIDYLLSSPDFPIVWIIPLIFYEIFGILLYRNAMNDYQLQSVRRLSIGYSVFFISYGFSMIFFSYSLFYADIGMESGLEFIALTRIGYILSLASYGFLIYGIESFILRTKGFLSIPPFITAILTLFLPYDVFRIITYVIGMISFIEIILIYVWIGLKGQSAAKKRAFSVVMGFLVLYFGIALSSVTGKVITTNLNVAWLSNYISPLLYIISTVILYHSFVRSIDLDQTKGLSNVWIIERDSGLCIYEHNFMKLDTNSDLVSGFLMANLSFGQELTKSKVKRIIFENLGIYFQHQDKFIVTMAITDDASIVDAERLLVKIADEFERKFHDVLGKNNGNITKFQDFNSIVDDLAKKQAITFDLLIQSQILKKSTENDQKNV